MRLMWVRYGVLAMMSAVALLVLPVALGHGPAFVRSGAFLVLLVAVATGVRVGLDAKRGATRHLGPQPVTTPRRRR